MKVIDEILSRHSLQLTRLLQKTAVKSIYLLEGNRNKYILKLYAQNTTQKDKEVLFIEYFNSKLFQILLFPQIIEHGENYILMEYLQREYITRDSILSKHWTDEDINLWVAGLLEFQKTELPSEPFSLKDKAMGFLYPPIRMLLLLPACIKLTGWKSLVQASIMGLRYILKKPNFGNVTVHYDLQTYNYTFLEGQRKMSMLDFEFSYYNGDPLFDILYYITIPIAGLRQWSFQSRLLKEFIKRYTNSNVSDYRPFINSIRLILLVCNLNRYLCFSRIGNHYAENKYFDNIKLLLNNSDYKHWITGILGCL